TVGHEKMPSLRPGMPGSQNSPAARPDRKDSSATLPDPAEPAKPVRSAEHADAVLHGNPRDLPLLKLGRHAAVSRFFHQALRQRNSTKGGSRSCNGSPNIPPRPTIRREHRQEGSKPAFPGSRGRR